MDGVAAVSALSVTLHTLLAAVLVRQQTGLWTMPFVQARARVKGGASALHEKLNVKDCELARLR